MKKKYKDFLIMLSIFMLFLFRNSINEIIIITSKNFDFSNGSKYTCKNIQEENEYLKDIIDFDYSLEQEYIISRVKYRDVLDFTDELQIFKGTKDGIAEGFAVINDRGLIGTISNADKHISEVMLITNKTSNISVKINNAYGILKFHDNTLEVSNITNFEDIAIGNEIYTSGLGKLPGNIYIGTVEEVKLSSLGIEQIVVVSPAVDFNNITYLMVVKP